MDTNAPARMPRELWDALIGAGAELHASLGEAQLRLLREGDTYTARALLRALNDAVDEVREVTHGKLPHLR